MNVQKNSPLDRELKRMVRREKRMYAAVVGSALLFASIGGVGDQIKSQAQQPAAKPNAEMNECKDANSKVSADIRSYKGVSAQIAAREREDKNKIDVEEKDFELDKLKLRLYKISTQLDKDIDDRDNVCDKPIVTTN